MDLNHNSGWINKKQDQEDKRVSRLFSSAKADKMKSELIELRKEANEKLLTEFNPEEQILFKRLLRDLIWR